MPNVHTNGTETLTEIERQLLRAALEFGFGPNTDLSRANTARVVDCVLVWRGLRAEQIEAGWRTDDCDTEHATVYATLVRLTHERALFEGGGNWGTPEEPDAPPCWPQYNSCRLTTEGERLARALASLDTDSTPHPAESFRT